MTTSISWVRGTALYSGGLAPILTSVCGGRHPARGQEGSDFAMYGSADPGSCARRTEARGDAQRAWRGLSLGREGKKHAQDDDWP